MTLLKTSIVPRLRMNLLEVLQFAVFKAPLNPALWSSKGLDQLKKMSVTQGKKKLDLGIKVKG